MILLELEDNEFINNSEIKFWVNHWYVNCRKYYVLYRIVKSPK